MGGATRHRDIVVDGANLAYRENGGPKRPSWQRLRGAIDALRKQHPDQRVVTIMDASAKHLLSDDERRQFELDQGEYEVTVTPAGLIAANDEFILSEADARSAVVVSNDSFNEYVTLFPWLVNEPGRLLGAANVAGRWRFDPRRPRGAGNPRPGRPSANGHAPAPAPVPVQVPVPVPAAAANGHAPAPVAAANGHAPAATSKDAAGSQARRGQGAAGSFPTDPAWVNALDQAVRRDLCAPVPLAGLLVYLAGASVELYPKGGALRLNCVGVWARAMCPAEPGALRTRVQRILDARSVPLRLHHDPGSSTVNVYRTVAPSVTTVTPTPGLPSPGETLAAVATSDAARFSAPTMSSSGATLSPPMTPAVTTLAAPTAPAMPMLPPPPTPAVPMLPPPTTPAVPTLALPMGPASAATMTTAPEPASQEGTSWRERLTSAFQEEQHQCHSVADVVAWLEAASVRDLVPVGELVDLGQVASLVRHVGISGLRGRLSGEIERALGPDGPLVLLRRPATEGGSALQRTR